MTIILLQVVALVVFAWLLRGSSHESEPSEIREPVEVTPRKRS